MNVVANKDFANLITKGNEYLVEEELGAFYKVKNNFGVSLKYHKSLFDEVKEEEYTSFDEQDDDEYEQEEM